MNELEPTAITPERRAGGLAEVIASLDEQRALAFAAGDWERLVRGGIGTRTVINDLRALLDQTERDIAVIVDEVGERRGAKTYIELPGVGGIEVSGGYERKQWESTELLGLLIEGVLVRHFNPDPVPLGLVDDLFDALNACIPATGSMQWRVTGLDKYGIDHDEYCAKTKKPRKARLPKVDP